MTKEIWINLPVKDVKRSREFFSKLGFTFNERGSSEHSLSMFVGEKNVIFMLFEEAMFQNFTQHTITDTSKSTEVLFSIDAESREEVDQLAKAAADAGGDLFAPPGENQGWMYGCAFADPDGHRWNVLYMDMSKIPQ